MWFVWVKGRRAPEPTCYFMVKPTVVALSDAVPGDAIACHQLPADLQNLPLNILADKHPAPVGA